MKTIIINESQLRNIVLLETYKGKESVNEIFNPFSGLSDKVEGFLDNVRGKVRPQQTPSSQPPFAYTINSITNPLAQKLGKICNEKYNKLLSYIIYSGNDWKERNGQDLFSNRELVFGHSDSAEKAQRLGRFLCSYFNENSTLNTGENIGSFIQKTQQYMMTRPRYKEYALEIQDIMNHYDRGEDSLQRGTSSFQRDKLPPNMYQEMSETVHFIINLILDMYTGNLTQYK